MEAEAASVEIRYSFEEKERMNKNERVRDVLWTGIETEAALVERDAEAELGGGLSLLDLLEPLANRRRHKVVDLDLPLVAGVAVEDAVGREGQPVLSSLAHGVQLALHRVHVPLHHDAPLVVVNAHGRLQRLLQRLLAAERVGRLPAPAQGVGFVQH